MFPGVTAKMGAMVEERADTSHMVEEGTSKAVLRGEMIARRDAMPESERGRIVEALTGTLVSLPQYAAARSVLATMAIGSEWGTAAFIERCVSDGKRLVLPRVSAPPRHLELHAVLDVKRDLVAGVWNIPEPDPAR